jgi:hypothetical protein
MGAIEVFFTGLMLICLDGQRDCPVKGPGLNTAWVVQATPGARPCGRTSVESTTLKLRFQRTDFDAELQPSGSASCRDDEENPGFTVCVLPQGEICLDVPGAEKLARQRREPSFRSLLDLAEIDSRFQGLRPHLQAEKSYLPSRIHFSLGSIGSGDLWPHEEGWQPVRWARSDGDRSGALPRALSDRMRVTYEGAREIRIHRCGTAASLSLVPREGGAQNPSVTFANETEVLRFEERGDFNVLSFLAWYYPLGKWATGDGRCPSAKGEEKAVLLRCRRPENLEYCACYGPNAAADTTFWPPVVRTP